MSARFFEFWCKLNKSPLEAARGDDPDSGSVGNSANRNDACRSERAE
jgi:hypothetical protein